MEVENIKRTLLSDGEQKPRVEFGGEVSFWTGTLRPERWIWPGAGQDRGILAFGAL